MSPRKEAVGRWALALGLSLCPLPGQTQQHHDHTHGGTPPAPATLGQVHFPVSCTPEAQAAFDEAMKLQHSFWYEAAGEAFRRVRARDPDCVMAYWGEAMALLVNPFTVTTAANLRGGRALLAEARRIGAKSEREAGFIEALSELYGDEDPSRHRARVARYEEAMGRLHARFPDDSEVAIHYALALTMAAPPTDKTYAKLIRAGELLQREADRQPQHPGVQHYLIHAYDVPALAKRGLPAAERYAGPRRGRAARAAHALAHLHPRRPLGEVDRDQPPLRRDGARAQGGLRRDPRPRLHGLRLSPDRADRGGAAHARRAAALRRLERAGADLRLGAHRDAGALRAGARRVGRGGGARARPADRAARRGEHPLRPRGRRRARRAPGRRGGRHRGAEGRRRGAAEQRRLLGGADGDPPPRRRGLGVLRPRRARCGPWPCCARRRSARAARTSIRSRRAR